MAKLIDLRDFRLVVFDIDGTLLPRGEVLSDLTRATLLALRENGLDFTLATGKSLPATRPLADELGINLPLVLCNGALIQTRQGKILHRTSLPLEITHQVIELCERRKQDVVVYMDDRLYVRQMTDNMRPICGNVACGLFEVGSWDNLGESLALTNKCVAVDTRPQKTLEALEEEFRRLVGERADVIRSSQELLEVMPRNVDKASGLRKLGDLLRIPMRQIMAFGDYDNDAAMLSTAGLGVAVAGASPAAVEAADVMVGACEQEGPAKYLDGLLRRS